MIDDGTIMKLGQDNFRWVGGQEYVGNLVKRTSKKEKF